MAAAVVVESAAICLRGAATGVADGWQSSARPRGLGPCSLPLAAPLRARCATRADCRTGGEQHGWRTGGFGSAAVVRSAPSAVVLRSAVADSPSVARKPHELYTVGDFMTSVDELYCVSPTSTVDEALEILVEKRVTGLPVVDENGKLVGVVSDYDLLALDSISGKRSRPDEGSLFPAANSTWKAFKEIQTLLGKTHGKTVRELMSGTPLVVREMTNIEDAARILLDTKYRRLPVVNEKGQLVGLLTRGNVVKAALTIKRKNDARAAA